MTIIKLKIGRREYDITENDTFLDNGILIQLMTQKGSYAGWGEFNNPVLSKRAIKEISKFERVQIEHDYGERCKFFSIKQNQGVSDE